ncbi:uncharacterized protein [Periplaneta americana]|uniref:uncharacterized protein isoform X6 n=1 Tax=Periplaneta americana TaxID=6978 RepID=UPI0037E86059
MVEVIKMEREIDLLAIERSNNTDRSIVEEKPLSEERNVLDLQVTGIKTECMDHSCDVKTEMTFDETSMPVDFSVVKSEVEVSAVYEEGNVLDLRKTEIKSEYMDQSYGLKSVITSEETSVPIDFAIVKSEFEHWSASFLRQHCKR